MGHLVRQQRLPLPAAGIVLALGDEDVAPNRKGLGIQFTRERRGVVAGVYADFAQVGAEVRFERRA